MEDIRWFERPVRMMRQDFDLNTIKDANLEEIARSRRDDWHVNCEWIIGTLGFAPGLGYLTTFNTPEFEKYPGLGDFDLVREYLPHARKYGVHLLAYLNMHWFSYDFAASHPDWEQLMSDGTPYGRVNPLYGGGTTLCVNSGWRDWAMKMIREAMKTGIDGVFLDGPLVYPECCYCDSCRLKFAERYSGAALPSAEAWTDQNWLDFVQFRSDSLAEFMSDARSVVRSVNPSGIAFLNAGTWHAGGWRTASNIDTLGNVQDFNGAEAFFHPGPSASFLYPWSAAAKHLAAGKMPAVVFSHHMLGPWHYVSLPPIEAKMMVAQTVANGANTWLAIMSSALESGKEYAVQPIREMHSFVEDNEKYFTNAESSATVALLSSHQTGTYYISALDDIYLESGSAREQNLVMDAGGGEYLTEMKKRKSFCEQLCDDSFQGYFTALTREHIPFDVILDQDLNIERLAQYKVLILPNSACLSDQQVEAVEEFVKRGGGLLAEFETGMYHDQGQRRDRPAFSSALGLSQVVGAMPPAAYEEYIKIKNLHPVMKSYSEGRLLPRVQYALNVKALKEADCPAIYMNQIGKLYAPLAGESDSPAIVTRAYEKGRSVYMPGLAGEFYSRLRIHDYQTLIGDAVRWLHAEPLPVEVDCPQTVEITLRHQMNPERTLIHLINCSGDMQRPLSEIISISDVEISLKCQRASRVSALNLGADLKFHVADGNIRFTLPRLDVYEAILVE